MTVETAKLIAQFLKNNFMFSITIMGGEVFCNPNWREILTLLIPAVSIVRIVSNGDWAEIEPEFASFLTQFNNVYVSISKDKWHTNKHIELAEKLLNDNDVTVKVCDLINVSDDQANVPIGRSAYEFTAYSAFSCYCHAPDKQYVFMIDEVGEIFKCGFGVWNYDNVENFQYGGFPERFRDLNERFYGIFVPNCKSCIRSYQNHLATEENENKTKTQTK